MKLYQKKLAISFIIASTFACQASEMEQDTKNNHLHSENEKKLLKASIRGDFAIVKNLINLKDCNINVMTDRGRTPLMLAAYHGHPEILEELFKYQVAIDLQDNRGNTALMLALIEINIMDSYLTDQPWYAPFSNINVINRKEEKKQKAMYFLLKRGADHTIKNKEGYDFKDLISFEVLEDNFQKFIKKQSKNIIKKRCNLILSPLYETWKIPKDLIKEFVSYLFKIDKNDKENLVSYSELEYK